MLLERPHDRQDDVLAPEPAHDLHRERQPGASLLGLGRRALDESLLGLRSLSSPGRTRLAGRRPVGSPSTLKRTE
jgi:hypothetical protein